MKHFQDNPQDLTERQMKDTGKTGAIPTANRPDFIKNLLKEKVTPREFEANTIQRFKLNEYQRRENLERKVMEQEIAEEQ